MTLMGKIVNISAVNIYNCIYLHPPFIIKIFAYIHTGYICLNKIKKIQPKTIISTTKTTKCCVQGAFFIENKVYGKLCRQNYSHSHVISYIENHIFIYKLFSVHIKIDP